MVSPKPTYTLLAFTQTNLHHRGWLHTILLRKVNRALCLVTDASFVAGPSPGVYHLPHTDIELLPSGQVVTLDRRCLAGSAIGLNRAVHAFMEFGGGSLADAVRAATKNAADLLPRRGVCSYIRKRQPANLVLFKLGTRELRVQSVILGGELVYVRN